MKIRLVYSTARLPGNPLFGTPIPAKPRTVPFFASLAGHILAIFAVTSLSFCPKPMRAASRRDLSIVSFGMLEEL